MTTLDSDGYTNGKSVLLLTDSSGFFGDRSVAVSALGRGEADKDDALVPITAVKNLTFAWPTTRSYQTCPLHMSQVMNNSSRDEHSEDAVIELSTSLGPTKNFTFSRTSGIQTSEPSA